MTISQRTCEPSSVPESCPQSYEPRGMRRTCSAAQGCLLERDRQTSPSSEPSNKIINKRTLFTTTQLRFSYSLCKTALYAKTRPEKPKKNWYDI